MDFQPGDHRVRCLAHILNLCCQAILASLLNVKSTKPVTLVGTESKDAEAHSIVGKVIRY